MINGRENFFSNSIILFSHLGCGNGKYLGVNPDLVMIGSDRSANLIEICK